MCIHVKQKHLTSDPKNIQLKRYDDGTPSVLRKQTIYADLFFYRKSDVLVQLTKTFCERFLPRYHDRTVDQMVQAARSIKQNLAEGMTDEEMCNTAITLCHMIDKMLTSFIAKLEKENAQLKSRIASQERELASAKAQKENP